MTAPRGPSSEQAYSVAIQNDGKIVAAGTDDTNFELVRYVETKPILSSFIVPTHASLGQQIQLSGLATDLSEGTSTLIHNWKIIGPGGFQVDLSGINVSFVAPVVGDFVATLSVTYGGGIVEMMSGRISVENNAPLITGFVVPTHWAQGQRVRLSGVATDLNQDAATLTYQWTVTGPNSFVAVLPGRNVSFIAPDEGTYSATLVVIDAQGLSATSSGDIVVENIAPTITGLVVPAEALEGERVRLTTRVCRSCGPMASITIIS